MKGLNALEIIFTLFVLIVVVLVVVRMFITRFTFAGIEQPIQDITETYNYEAAYSTCNSLCSKYESDCSNTQNAVKFCLQKANIDIDGNRIPGEKGKYNYNVVEGVPMCEDGIYCFRIKTDCACGAFRLSPETCLSILCNYYQQTLKYSPTITAELINNGIHYGNCEPNVRYWKIEDYTPISLPQDERYDSDWTDPDDPDDDIKYMGPDHWWVQAGYLTPCGVDIKTGVTFECYKHGGDKIRCEWSGIDIGIIEYCRSSQCLDDDDPPYKIIDVDVESPWTTDSMEDGKYYVILTWEGHSKEEIVDI